MSDAFEGGLYEALHSSQCVTYCRSYHTPTAPTVTEKLPV